MVKDVWYGQFPCIHNHGWVTTTMAHTGACTSEQLKKSARNANAGKIAHINANVGKIAHINANVGKIAHINAKRNLTISRKFAPEN
ncbi:hypothetical protein AYI69_g4072 [Smittium culicis]|uniref:Uncharacterized protein n=1 Tax=Smittium culicis TaxID=133412 RepID=A0A1R1YGS5_9FUNG|nr:hypothetical protein AYI69_g4072 [Smittium culicis]